MGRKERHRCGAGVSDESQHGKIPRDLLASSSILEFNKLGFAEGLLRHGLFLLWPVYPQ